jgi:hypothetical protein
MHAESDKQVNTSSAKCSVVAIGYSEANNDDAIASAGVFSLSLLALALSYAISTQLSTLYGIQGITHL